MIHRAWLQRVRRIAGILLLLALAWTGINGGYHERLTADTLGQRIQTAAQLGYGVFSLLVIYTVFEPRPWSQLVRRVWVALVTIAVGLAVVVWANAGALIGLVAAAGASFLALGVLWLVRSLTAGDIT